MIEGCGDRTSRGGFGSVWEKRGAWRDGGDGENGKDCWRDGGEWWIDGEVWCDSYES